MPRLFHFVLLLAVIISPTYAQEVLFDFKDKSQLDSIQANGLKMSIVDSADGSKLIIDSEHKIDWPGITLKSKSGMWDASKYQTMSFDIENLGEHSFEIGLRIDTPGDESKRVTTMTQVSPGESRTVSTDMTPSPWKFSEPLKLDGMHAAPGQQFIDQTNISQAIIFLRQPSQDHQFSIANIRFETPLSELDAKTFLPFIDRYGQFIHADWPGKIASDEDLLAKRDLEQSELASQPGPESFNRFGGWKNGEKLDPSKHFRTEKIDGKWWLIDPDGSKFWSHGIDSVSTNFSSTGVEHRESYFQDLPKEGEKGSEFFFDSTWGMGFYGSRTPYRAYNFLASNLSRKYGTNWPDQFSDLAHRRLRSWGINTMASWSDPKIYLQHKTPYVAFFRAEECPVVAGAQKMWTRFADVFDPKFEIAINEGMDSVEASIGDPWCIGFFVDNELYWGEDHSLALWTLQSPDGQACKKVFISDLKTKYDSIEKLNTKWQTKYASWDDLGKKAEAPELQFAKDDLVEFSKKFSETYFSKIRKALDERAPKQLYLGCRFIWQNPTAVSAACKSCDVVSFNCYRYSPEDIKLPKGFDKPVIIGEFHFGALDRGLFHPSKVPSKNQADRAKCYQNFVTKALQHPSIVGTHWFQYASEPTAGRGDGENYQVGFIDTCDTPYSETVAAAREMGNKMYRLRQSDE